MGSFILNYHETYNGGETDEFGKTLADKVTRDVRSNEDAVDVTVVVHMKSGKTHKDHVGRVAVAELTTLQVLVSHYFGDHDGMIIGGMENGSYRSAVIDTNEIEAVEITGTPVDRPSDEETRRASFGLGNPSPVDLSVFEQ